MTTPQLLLVPVSRRMSVREFVWLPQLMFALLHNRSSDSLSQEAPSKPLLHLQVQMKSALTALALALRVSLSEPGFLPHPAPVCASPPYNIQSRGQDCDLQWDCRKSFSSVSVMIPITITASTRGNNKYHLAFLSCLQRVYASGVWTCHVPSIWTPYFDLSVSSISATFLFSSPHTVDCDGCILRDTRKRPVCFSSFYYK